MTKITIKRLVTNWTAIPAHAQRALFLHFECRLTIEICIFLNKKNLTRMHPSWNMCVHIVSWTTTSSFSWSSSRMSLRQMEQGTVESSSGGTFGCLLTFLEVLGFSACVLSCNCPGVILVQYWFSWFLRIPDWLDPDGASCSLSLVVSIESSTKSL